MHDESEEVEELRHRVFHTEQMEKERAISDKKYADKKEFDLVQKIVFGACVLILVSVIGAIIALVVN